MAWSMKGSNGLLFKILNKNTKRGNNEKKIPKRKKG
jgi:hypothetical protein